MGIGTLYQQLVTEIIVQLKTITELIGTPNDPKVFKWAGPRHPIRGIHEAFVLAGPMSVVGGFTTKSTLNEFQIMIDTLHYAEEFDAGFDESMAVAEKVYDKFHLTTINNLVRIAQVDIFPGDGEISGDNLLAIPIRIIIKCELVITQ